MNENVSLSQKKLSSREKLFYGFGDLSTSLVWTVTTTWVMFFFTDIFGISAMAAGTLMLISRIYDAAIDPIIGAMIDRTNTKYGRARPYLLWLAVPYGLAGCLLFFTPNLSATGKLIYAYVFYFALVTIYSLINIPYNTMISLMTKDQKERSQLSRNRLLFAMAAYIFVSFIPAIANILGNGETTLQIQRTGFFRTAIILGALAACGWLLTFFNTREHVYETLKTKQEQQSILKQLRILSKNRPWIITTLMTLFTNMRIGILTSMVAYYSKYYLMKPEGFSTVVLVPTILGVMLGLVLGPMLINRVSVRRAILIASSVSILASVLIWVAGSNTAFLIIVMAVFGIFQGVPSVATYPMYGDAVEYGEWKTGTRIEGMIYASYTFMQQVASGVAGFLIGSALTLLGYSSELAVQSDITIRGISFIFVIAPIILSLLVILVMSFYPLDKEKYNKIVHDLATRSSESAAGGM